MAKMTSNAEIDYIRCPHVQPDEVESGFFSQYGLNIWLQRTTKPFIKVVFCSECRGILESKILGDYLRKGIEKAFK